MSTRTPIYFLPLSYFSLDQFFLLHSNTQIAVLLLFYSSDHLTSWLTSFFPSQNTISSIFLIHNYVCHFWLTTARKHSFPLVSIPTRITVTRYSISTVASNKLQNWHQRYRETGRCDAVTDLVTYDDTVFVAWQRLFENEAQIFSKADCRPTCL